MSKRSLLPIQGQGKSPHDQVREPHRAGLAKQNDHFLLLIGRFLKYLGITGTLVEIGASAVALFLEFTNHPGPLVLDWWWRAAGSAFIALCVEAAQFLLILNLNDSFQHLFSAHPERAFITEGEVDLQNLLLWGFVAGGVALNAWWNFTFLTAITDSGWLISLGMFVLFFAGLLLWPLGDKVIRNARRRINAAKRLAAEIATGAARQQATAPLMPSVAITPVTDPAARNLIPFNNKQ